ncbi:MAG: DUF4037 domain-containing protein [Candidatus Hodarchaeota archaeon]
MKCILKGDNQLEEFRRIAGKLSSKISSLEGVVGIVFIDGLTRGFTDQFSDVDIMTFLDKRDESLIVKIRKMGLEEETRSRVDIDLEIHSLEEFRTWKWDEALKWELFKAEVVHDSRGKMKKLFQEKLRPSEDFWVKRIVICAEYLKWYCCPPRKEIGTVAEAWIERGDLKAAHYCISYAIDLLIKILYVLNKEFLPAPKWRVFYSYQLKWLPEDFKNLAKQVMITKSFSVKEFNRRLKAVRQLWQKTIPKIQEEFNLTPEQISKYYVKKILCQT